MVTKNYTLWHSFLRLWIAHYKHHRHFFFFSDSFVLEGQWWNMMRRFPELSFTSLIGGLLTFFLPGVWSTALLWVTRLCFPERCAGLLSTTAQYIHTRTALKLTYLYILLTGLNLIYLSRLLRFSVIAVIVHFGLVVRCDYCPGKVCALKSSKWQWEGWGLHTLEP